MELINDFRNRDWEFQYDSSCKTMKIGFYREDGTIEYDNEVRDVDIDNLSLALELVAYFNEDYYKRWSVEATFNEVLPALICEPQYYMSDVFPSDSYLMMSYEDKIKTVKKELHLDMSFEDAISLKRKEQQKSDVDINEESVN